MWLLTYLKDIREKYRSINQDLDDPIIEIGLSLKFSSN
jgi:hypothetical protein